MPAASEPRPSEADLVRRFQAGDAEALELLMERHAATLQRYLARWLPLRLRRRVSGADLLQDARLVALSKASAFEYRGEGSFRNWLLAILRHEVRGQVRRHRGAARRDVRREALREARPETGQLAGRVPAPSEVAIAAELAAIARAALRELSPDYREVLRLVREEGVSLVEAATRMERSHEATKKLYARALACFAREFERRRGGTHHGRSL